MQNIVSDVSRHIDIADETMHVSFAFAVIPSYLRRTQSIKHRECEKVTFGYEWASVLFRYIYSEIVKTAVLIFKTTLHFFVQVGKNLFAIETIGYEINEWASFVLVNRRVRHCLKSTNNLRLCTNM